jgi:hypothetical protein
MYIMGAKGFVPLGFKRQELEADHSPPTFNVKNGDTVQQISHISSCHNA